jgi:ribosomal protein L37AE/L43A
MQKGAAAAPFLIRLLQYLLLLFKRIRDQDVAELLVRSELEEMREYHCCATCTHYEIRRDMAEKFYCSRLGFATSPKYQFNCWVPKDDIQERIKKETTL